MPRYLLENLADVARLTFDNPPVNVLGTAMLDEMAADIERSAARALIVRGAGRLFSAGMDVREHMPQDVDAMLRAVRRFFEALWRFDGLVVATVHGKALGGGAELLLLCDFVFLHVDSEIAFPEVAVGAYPPLAAVVLPGRVGWTRAADLVLSGRTLRAPEAVEWGLATAVHDTPQALEMQLARVFERSASVQRVARRAMRVGDDLFARYSEAERIYRDDLTKTNDALEGVLAFMGRREPRWSHR